MNVQLSTLLQKARDSLWQWLLPTLGAALSGIVLASEKYFVTLIPTPPELWAVRAIALSLALMGLLIGAYYWYRNKYIYTRPNLSKKTDTQEQILIALMKEGMPCRIAKSLNSEEHFVLRNLELLKKDLLVAPDGFGSSSWHLTEHGRAYLYPNP